MSEMHTNAAYEKRVALMVYACKTPDPCQIVTGRVFPLTGDRRRDHGIRGHHAPSVDA
jgi:hypothetical protein